MSLIGITRDDFPDPPDHAYEHGSDGKGCTHMHEFDLRNAAGKVVVAEHYRCHRPAGDHPSPVEPSDDPVVIVPDGRPWLPQPDGTWAPPP
ncbi:hypothetical protein SEA_BIBWIT_75 [Gordonia phage Bibwit]|uniref:Uncharacterized protein n=7 Tax=Vividuovirus TaxID=2560251 RepID=A0A2U9PFN5_9CAUD|nr:hypothetical protein KNU06_gp75 [Gordonia phage Angelicage]YP_010099151.1 hypothetical protein KNU17_gp74 [Gordonia phage Ailee]YP_010099235.1 hypothetical protein KNU18_gp75 [Gordonia phage Bibwit]YP_010099571.1 hypothetical protein KNU22_gp72 [Gordonia phage Stultus]YP_010104487.1 hypothetical protein KNU76_gp75 [Gordonia phage Jabberwocky]YP_010104571.1 hypothetical protein KNU77_gp75 [Gordonia phage Keitabear]AWT50574.1 hypothetical protein PBI_SITAR_76 [Gordonia phage Sitar]AYR02460.